MCFYDNFIYECNKKKIKPTTLLQQLHMSKGNLARWRAGKIPGWRTLELLARTFDIGVDELVGSSKKYSMEKEGLDKAIEAGVRTVSPEKEPVVDLAKMLREEPGLMFNGAPLSDEDREKVLKAIKFAIDLSDKK